jgi:hypothetical protein
MEVTTLVIAIIGAVTGIGSLAWQVVTFRQSGPVVTVTATQAMPTYGAEVGDPHVDVTARNTGRSPVTVTGWGLRFPDGQGMIFPNALRWSTSLPHRLEPGANASWYWPTEEVKRASAERGVRYQDLTAYVNLADGRTINAKRRGIGWK